MIDEVVLFLEGKQDSLLARLQREMVESAEHFNFETAARIRDRIVHVRRVTENQKVVWRSRLDMDLIAIARARRPSVHASRSSCAAASSSARSTSFSTAFTSSRDAVLFGRVPQTVLHGAHGERAGRHGNVLRCARIARDNQAPVPLESARARRVAARRPFRKKCWLQALPEERATIEAWLSEIKGRARARCCSRSAATRADYMRLVQKNAEQNLKAFLAHQEVQETAQARSLTDLADALELPRAAAPHRVLRHLEHSGHRIRSHRWSCSSKGAPRRASTGSSKFNTIAGRTISR